MFTEKHFLRSISGEELDHYLERGWYRLGQLVFTCYFIFFQNKLYSPIWIRLPLNDYRFRKSVRKLMQRVESEFEIVVVPGAITEAKEELYQNYRNNFNGEIAPSLVDSLQDQLPFNIFNSKNIEVFHGKKMIAFSFFDLGEKSLASIKGVYDPAYSKYSLGLYTMLKEIEYGMEKGYDFYYPGYVVPGYSRFDYKLRIGKMTEVEFFDAKTKSWDIYNNIKESHILVKELSAKLAKVAWALTKKNISSQLLFYQIMDSQITFLRENNSLKSPLILSLFNDLFEDAKFLIYFDIETDEYVFVHSLNIDKANPILTIKCNLEIPALDSLKEKGSVILRTKSEINIIDQVMLVSSLLEGFDRYSKK